MIQALRTAGGVVAGILLVSVIAETIEFGLVSLVNGGMPRDPAQYFSIRNGDAFLAAKYACNGIAGMIGGYVAAWIARARPLAHGVVVAALQAIAFAAVTTNPEVAATAPTSAWIGFAFVTCAGMIAGAWARALRPA